MSAASIVSNRRFNPSMDQTRSEVEDQQAARTGDFQDIADALGLGEVTA